MQAAMGSRIVFAAASAVFAIQSVSTSAQVAPLTPSSPWLVDYADKMCILQRTFGTGSNKITLGFKPAPGGGSMAVLVLAPGDSSLIKSGKARVTIDANKPVDTSFLEGPVRGPKKFRVVPDKTRIMAIDLKRADLFPLSAVKQIRIEAGDINALVAPTQLPEALKALMLCEQDLLASWGMDPKVVANIAEFPTVDASDLSTYFTRDDYPIEALAAGFQGIAGARVFVGADGRVNQCSIIETSGSVALDAQTCEIIKNKAHYKPARLRSGEKVASFTFARIRWELPSS